MPAVRVTIGIRLLDSIRDLIILLGIGWYDFILVRLTCLMGYWCLLAVRLFCTSSLGFISSGRSFAAGFAVASLKTVAYLGPTTIRLSGALFEV